MKRFFKASKEAKATQSQDDLFDLMREVERQREELQDLLRQSERQQIALRKIKAFVDAVWNSKVAITIGNNDFDPFNHVYDVNVIIGSIRPLVYEVLGLSNSNITKERRWLV